MRPLFNPFDYPGLSFSDLQDLPEKTGVYIVHEFGRVLYVGKAKNLRSRWANHHRIKQIQTQNPSAIICWKLVDPCFLDEVEELFIDWFAPTLNRKKIPMELRADDCTVRFPESKTTVLKMLAASENKTLCEYLGDLVEADRQRKGLPIFEPQKTA